jgi:hypothetical protein
LYDSQEYGGGIRPRLHTRVLPIPPTDLLFCHEAVELTAKQTLLPS